MKKRILVLAISIFTLACSHKAPGKNTSPNNQTPPTSTENIEFSLQCSTGQIITYTVTGEGQVAIKECLPNEEYFNSKCIVPSTVENNGITYTVTSIQGESFFSASLESIEIPNTVTTIEAKAFQQCEELVSINIPNSVTRIGEQAFCWCPYLSSITIPNSITTIEDGTFLGCIHLSSISIPNSVKTIDDEAFSYCYHLPSINIPQSVTSIGEDVFKSCDGLTSIVVDKKNPVYDSRDNCNAIIVTASNEIIARCNKTTIPNGCHQSTSY